MKEKNRSDKKYTWKLKEYINPLLTENEIRNIVNKKIAYVIIEEEKNIENTLLEEQ